MRLVNRVIVVSAVLLILTLLTFSCGKDKTSSSQCNQLFLQKIGWGTASASPQAACYDSGARVTLSATPEHGWVWVGWEGDVSNTANPLVITIPDSDLSVNARFALEDYTISVSAVPASAGTVVRSPNQSTYHLNDAVTLSASAADGYTFDRWSGDTSTTVSQIAVTVESDISLIANFTGSGPDSVTLNGSITWPGHVLSHPILVLFDIDFNILAYWEYTGGSQTVNFTAKFSIIDIAQSYVHAVDNLDNDGLIFETGEPWNCYDADVNYYCDYLTYTSGQIINNVNISLYSAVDGKAVRDYEIGPVKFR